MVFRYGDVVVERLWRPIWDLGSSFIQSGISRLLQHDFRTSISWNRGFCWFSSSKVWSSESASLLPPRWYLPAFIVILGLFEDQGSSELPNARVWHIALWKSLFYEFFWVSGGIGQLLVHYKAAIAANLGGEQILNTVRHSVQTSPRSLLCFEKSNEVAMLICGPRNKPNPTTDRLRRWCTLHNYNLAVQPNADWRRQLISDRLINNEAFVLTFA